MTAQRLSAQLGAAIAALAFPVLGPAGVVAIRQWVAGAVLLSYGAAEVPVVHPAAVAPRCWRSR